MDGVGLVEAAPQPVSTPDPRLYPAFPMLAVSIAVFREGRVLLATRTKPPFDGIFSLPGGVVEIGESLADAALRELREEVDVDAEIVAFNRHIESIGHDADGRIRTHFVIASFAATWRAGEGTPGPEAGEVRWVLPADIPHLAHTPQVPELVASGLALVAAHQGRAT